MSEMLDQLLVKQRLEAEDAQRQIAIALNGMAGISMLENEWERAASFYREVLKEKEVAVDIPVRIHAAHHLQTVLQYHLKGDKVRFFSQFYLVVCISNSSFIYPDRKSCKSLRSLKMT